ncbi:MAG: SIS domain-containing protein [Puniceicoccaceae bacterium]
MRHFESAQAVFENEIDALGRTLDRIRPQFDAVVDLLIQRRGKIVATGIGKSGIIAHKVSATFASTGSPSVFLNAGEALHGDLGIISSDDAVLMFSHSANTPELSRMVPSIRRIGAPLIGVFGAIDTPLAVEMDRLLDATINREACPLGLAPMTSSTVALVIGDSLAAAMMRARGFTAEEFAVFHPGGTLGRRLLFRVKDVMQTQRLPKVPPGATLGETVKVLSDSGYGAAVVVDHTGRIGGILTEGDVRRAFLEKRALEDPIETVMTSAPKCINLDASLGDALDEMERERKVYVLPVTDAADRLVGILRMHDIIV